MTQMTLWVLVMTATFFGTSACNRNPRQEKVAVAPPEVRAAPADIAALKEKMIEIRDVYRKTIAVMWHEDEIPVERRGNVWLVGQYLYENNQKAIDEVQLLLSEEMDDAAGDDFRAPAFLEGFLDMLETDDAWWDADKLVFQEVVTSLLSHLSEKSPTSPRGKALKTRLSEDAAALSQIQKLYENEMEKVFARLDTRGMSVKRQKWASYMAHLASLYSATDILNAVEPSVTAGNRGAAPSAGAGKTINGSGFPDKTVMLTFDDGPHDKNTGKILDLLKQYQVKGIFFEVGRSIGKIKGAHEITLRKRAEASRRVAAEGHVLANHTVNHPVLPRLKDDEIAAELTDTKTLLGRVGQANVTLFRPPYGAMGERVAREIQKEHMTPVLWNIDSRDWADPIPRSIANRVIGQTRKLGHGVILFHDIHDRTVDALALVLDTLTKDGFRFVLHDGAKLIEPETEEPLNPEGTASRLYRKSHAVVIGINDYQKWPKLNFAVNDAESMRDLLLQTFQFDKENVHVLLNEAATRAAILELLGDTFTSPDVVDAEDRVFVFFAGHGTTRVLPSGRSLGYIIPVDADPSRLESQSISMSVFQDINEAIPAKHIFYIMDACYGGQALVRGGGTANPQSEKYLKEVTSRPVRQMLTAGGADEQVSDAGPGGHSIFTWSVLEGLRGKADLNGDSHISAGELFAHVGPIVSSLSQQTPAFGSLVGSKGGEFIFELKSDDEFLSRMSAQLDDEAIELNAQIEAAKEALQQKQSNNDRLKKELAAVHDQLAELGERGAPTVSEPSNKTAAQYRRDGMALFRERRYEEAAQVFLKAYEKAPDSALTTNNLGFAYFMMGDFAGALKWYEKTIAIAPDRSVVYINLGELYEEQNDAARAKAAYRKFLELAPEHKLAANVTARLERLGAD